MRTYIKNISAMFDYSSWSRWPRSAKQVGHQIWNKSTYTYNRDIFVQITEPTTRQCQSPESPGLRRSAFQRMGYTHCQQTQNGRLKQRPLKRTLKLRAHGPLHCMITYGQPPYAKHGPPSCATQGARIQQQMKSSKPSCLPEQSTLMNMYRESAISVLHSARWSTSTRCACCMSCLGRSAAHCSLGNAYVLPLYIASCLFPLHGPLLLLGRRATSSLHPEAWSRQGHRYPQHGTDIYIDHHRCPTQLLRNFFLARCLPQPRPLRPGPSFLPWE